MTVGSAMLAMAITVATLVLFPGIGLAYAVTAFVILAIMLIAEKLHNPQPED